MTDTGWLPAILTLFPARDGHEGTLTVRTPHGRLIVEVRRWHKVSGHVEMEVRYQAGDASGEPDAEFAEIERRLVGKLQG